MRTFLFTLLAVVTTLAASGRAEAQQTSTYYYCYAYENDGARVWVSQVRYGDRYSYPEYLRDFDRNIRDSYNVQYFSASGCRPFDQNTDRPAIEDDRSQFINTERNRRGKNVIFLN